MKVKDGFVLRHVMDSDIVVDVTGKFSGVVKLNGSSAQIWNYIAAGSSMAEAADKLAQAYGITAEQALADTEKFCAEMIKHGFFEE